MFRGTEGLYVNNEIVESSKRQGSVLEREMVCEAKPEEDGGPFNTMPSPGDVVILCNFFPFLLSSWAF